LHVESRRHAVIQPGLFDRRAADSEAADLATRAETSDVIDQRIARLESMADIDINSRPRLRLVLLP
jgi:hypothetical protein